MSAVFDQCHGLTRSQFYFAIDRRNGELLRCNNRGKKRRKRSKGKRTYGTYYVVNEPFPNPVLF